MSLKDTSIEERPIISSLAATSSFSAVAFLAVEGRGGMLVFNCDPIACLGGEMRAQITRCGAHTQELIDRLTKSFTLLKPASSFQTPPKNQQGGELGPRLIRSPPHAPRAAAREDASPAGIRRISPLPCWTR